MLLKILKLFFLRLFFCLSLLFTQLSCQSIHNLVDQWFMGELIPEPFILTLGANIVDKNKSAYFEGLPAQKSRAIEAKSLGIEFHAARFETPELSIAAFLETKTIKSQSLQVQKNNWAYLSDDKKEASIWQDHAVYYIKSVLPRKKDFYIKLFEKITHKLPPRRRPPYLRIFLHPDTNILNLRYFWKNNHNNSNFPAISSTLSQNFSGYSQNKQNPILTDSFYAPWHSKDKTIILAIHPFSDDALAKRFFYKLVELGSQRLLTQWNSNVSMNKNFLLNEEQNVTTHIEKKVSYPIVIADHGLHHDYFILHESNVILLTGKIKKREAQESISKIFQYLD